MSKVRVMGMTLSAMIWVFEEEWQTNQKGERRGGSFQILKMPTCQNKMKSLYWIKQSIDNVSINRAASKA